MTSRSRTRGGYQARQALEIASSRAARQRHAAGPECRGLAQMDVGDKQAALAWPVQRTLGEQLDALVGKQHRFACRCTTLVLAATWAPGL